MIFCEWLNHTLQVYQMIRALISLILPCVPCNRHRKSLCFVTFSSVFTLFDSIIQKANLNNVFYRPTRPCYSVGRQEATRHIYRKYSKWFCPHGIPYRCTSLDIKRSVFYSRFRYVSERGD